MADSADLVVLGAYFGTGNKGTAHSLINIWTGVRVYMCIYLEMHFFLHHLTNMNSILM